MDFKHARTGLTALALAAGTAIGTAAGTAALAQDTVTVAYFLEWPTAN